MNPSDLQETDYKMNKYAQLTNHLTTADLLSFTPSLFHILQF